jgi:uncharacterized protein (DUF302 family)
MSPKGVVIRPGLDSVKNTIDSLLNNLIKRGVTIYARINQEQETAKAGIHLAPLEFIMFGAPAVGGNIMRENIIASLDLPLKIIAWEDEQKKIWVAYNDASYVGERFSLSEENWSKIDLEGLISVTLNSK